MQKKGKTRYIASHNDILMILLSFVHIESSELQDLGVCSAHTVLEPGGGGGFLCHLR